MAQLADPRSPSAPATGPNDAPAIELRAVRKVFKTGRAGEEIVALDGVDLEVKRGEVYGVVGRSGSGKSTLVRCVNRLEEPTSGSVHVEGLDLTHVRGAELRAARRRIGVVFQHFNLLTSRTAAANVALPLEILGVPRRERERRAHELLELVGLGERAQAYPSQLSGGQKQRVGIARALAADPAVLLSDEATSALDGETTASFLDLLRDLGDRLGLTVLLITHEMSVVKRACDSVGLLDEGRLVESGPIGELAIRPDSAVADRLLPEVHPPAAAPGTTLLDVVAADPRAERAVTRAVADGQATLGGAAIETIGGRRIGRMTLVVDAQADPGRIAEALRGDGARVTEVRA